MLCLGKASLLTFVQDFEAGRLKKYLQYLAIRSLVAQSLARVVVNRGCSSPCSTSVFKIG